MSSTRTTMARFGAAAITLGAVLAISGCGFQPIHGQRSQAASAALATIDINLISDRTGQMLRNELVTLMQPRGTARQIRFSLSVSVSESLENLAIRKDDVATRANLALTANFTISRRPDGKSVLSGSARSVNSYDILTSEFATLSAKEDARRRAVRQLAQDIKERVSVWLIQTGGRKVPPAQ